MHNNIMAAGSRDRPLMLATGRYPQWRSWFLRYIDTRPNGEALWKCILSGPYKPTTVLVQAVEATDDSPVVPEHTTSTVDACQTTQEMWEAIERLQQDMDEEVDEQELEAHYNYMAKIQEVPTADSGTESEPVEQVENDTGYNVFANELQHSEQSESNDQNDVESDDECVVLANLKLNVDENKKIQKQLKKAKTTLAQELKECKAILAETKIVDNAWIKHSKDQFRAPTAQDMEILIQACLRPLATKTQNDSFRFVHELKQEMHADLKCVESLEKEIDKLESDKAEFLDMYDDLKAQLQDKNIAISELKKLIEKGKGKSVDTKFDKPSVVRQPNAQRIPKPSVLGKPTLFLDSLERMYFPKTKSVPKANVSEGLSKLVTAQTLPQAAKKAVSKTNVLKPGMYRIDNRTAHTRAPQLPQTVRNTNPRVSTSTGVNHTTNVSRPQLKSNQSIDKVLLNNSQVKVKKTQVEVHPRIPSVLNK
uniref:Integrase, catalytic region, zinc finger, CCHC-type, peptidase aspartic, catalytic n=1 Tax=Tanacetum cinerariifolium TaxID=118510 RepID=A0A6L2K8E6_TANCI|nr:hypothetical protein [Tanacetum cinerariifolium]